MRDEIYAMGGTCVDYSDVYTPAEIIDLYENALSQLKSNAAKALYKELCKGDDFSLSFKDMERIDPDAEGFYELEDQGFLIYDSWTTDDEELNPGYEMIYSFDMFGGCRAFYRDGQKFYM